MKSFVQNTGRRNAAAIMTIAVTMLVATLLSSMIASNAEAAKGIGNKAPSMGTTMVGSGALDRVNDVRGPVPDKKKPLPPCTGRHCNWQHQH